MEPRRNVVAIPEARVVVRGYASGHERPGAATLYSIVDSRPGGSLFRLVLAGRRKGHIQR
eukprot:scaffold1162_cov372-Prasinococcus_capsulatus_cf.AAC.4